MTTANPLNKYQCSALNRLFWCSDTLLTIHSRLSIITFMNSKPPSSNSLKPPDTIPPVLI